MFSTPAILRWTLRRMKSLHWSEALYLQTLDAKVVT
jgi:hypothetical protein